MSNPFLLKAGSAVFHTGVLTQLFQGVIDTSCQPSPEASNFSTTSTSRRRSIWVQDLAATAQRVAAAHQGLDFQPFGIRERDSVRIRQSSGRDGGVFGFSENGNPTLRRLWQS